MTEDLKHIVNGVTKLLAVNYNMISFDALSPEKLLQVLVEVLSKFEACPRFDVRDDMAPEEVLRRLLEGLKKIQYQPKNDNINPIVFQRGLLDGEKRIIYPILKWVFENEDMVRESSYLGKYLLPLNLPPEALAIPEISRLMAQHQAAVEEFVGTHREYKRSQAEGGQLRELKSDTESIELEIENVRKRVEKTQARVDKIPNQDLFLEAAHGLRVEKDRQRELQAQLDEQKQGLQKAFMQHERLNRELNNAKVTTHSSSSDQLLDAIVEETSVLQFMVDVKLPQELLAEEKQLAVYQSVVAEPNLNGAYLESLQRNIDLVNRDIQVLVEAKMANAQNDNLITFRQQANSVARNKDMAAEKLNQLTKELRDIETILRERQLELQDTIGEVVLRGDDLKQYVNTLRAKSSIYKQKRTELATLKAEASDLSQTLENLKSQDPNLNFSHLEDESTGNSLELSLDMSLEGHGLGELSRLVEGLSRAVRQARERVTPLSQKLRPLRDRLQDLKEEHEAKKQSYDALNLTLTSEATAVRTDIKDTENEIHRLEDQYRMLQIEKERAELLIENAQAELQAADDGEFKITVQDSLGQQIRDEESKLLRAQKELNYLRGSKEERLSQMSMWSDLCKLLQIKLKCAQEQKSNGLGGTMQIDRNAQTFTLQ